MSSSASTASLYADIASTPSLNHSSSLAALLDSFIQPITGGSQMHAPLLSTSSSSTALIPHNTQTHMTSVPPPPPKPEATLDPTTGEKRKRGRPKGSTNKPKTISTKTRKGNK
jgi:hypothetical protein